jgi:hypothetical protein
MSVFETGNICWKEFVFRGQRIQESTQQTWSADWVLGVSAPARTCHYPKVFPSITRIAELAGASDVLIKLIEELKTGANCARQLKCEQARPAVNGQPVTDNAGISSPLRGAALLWSVKEMP